MKNDEKVTVRIPRTLVKQVEAIAAKNHRAIVGEVAFALEKYVEENRHIVEAAQQEAGR